MGKKRIIASQQETPASQVEAERLKVSSGRKRLENGILHIQSTYNNTKMVLTDEAGNAVISSSSGAMGFKGAKKGTPFAAAKVGEFIGGRAAALGVREVTVLVRGVGSGRESSIRSFAGKGINIKSIKDVTPVPFNGPKPKKPRRV